MRENKVLLTLELYVLQSCLLELANEAERMENARTTLEVILLIFQFSKISELKKLLK